MSHYETLDVPKGANAETVKKAFRSKARKAHPDKGGSTEEMAKLNQAYAVLSDAGRKAKYDETGDDKEAPTKESASHSILAQLFSQALEQHNVNPVVFARDSMYTHLEMVKNQGHLLTKKVASLTSRKKDVDVDEGMNLFHSIIDQQIEGFKGQLTALTQQEEQIRAALELLNHYSSKVVPQREQTPQYYTSTSTFA